MAGGGPDGYEDDPLAVGSYSQLLFSDDVVVDDLDADDCSFTLSSDQHPPKMLCFGDFAEECDLVPEKRAPKILQKKLGGTCSDSSSNIINTTETTNNSLSKANKKRNVSSGTTGARVQVDQKKNQNSGDGNGGSPVLGNRRNCKKTKPDNSSDQSTGNAKAKKEKLGERILALQQLVSPFGKADTASVLHEAMGYIRFLHDQESGENGGGGGEVESRRDLRSKGLCVVPIQLTLHVADDNGADFWSPAMVNNVSSN